MTGPKYSLIDGDGYYGREEVSNSDLGFIQKYWEPETIFADKQAAYKFGSLVDAIITEQHRVNYLTYRVDEVQYTREDFDQAKAMKRAFMADSMAAAMLTQSNTQAVMVRDVIIEHEDFSFPLSVRCKWDLWMEKAGWGGDIKSTAATTQAQFIAACKYFDYDRQRAWYMDIAGSDRDILIGISKKNNKVFHLPITRGDAFYNSGRAKYEELAFKNWYLFSEPKK
jgi:hypothetical protein